MIMAIKKTVLTQKKKKSSKPVKNKNIKQEEIITPVMADAAVEDVVINEAVPAAEENVTDNVIENTEAKRTRKAHAEDCMCSVCKRKRGKAERAETSKEEMKAVVKEEIIKEYIASLPKNETRVLFEQDTITAIENKWTVIKERHPAETNAERGNKLMNHAIKFYLNTI
jgi:hypothetical protein